VCCVLTSRRLAKALRDSLGVFHDRTGEFILVRNSRLGRGMWWGGGVLQVRTTSHELLKIGFGRSIYSPSGWVKGKESKR
jgi:hypothetical protein